MLNAIKYFSNNLLKFRKNTLAPYIGTKKYAIVKLTMRSNELKQNLWINC